MCGTEVLGGVGVRFKMYGREVRDLKDSGSGHAGVMLDTCRSEVSEG